MLGRILQAVAKETSWGQLSDPYKRLRPTLGLDIFHSISFVCPLHISAKSQKDALLPTSTTDLDETDR